MGFSFVYGTVHLSLGKYAQWENDSDLIPQTYDSVQEMEQTLPDDGFYRLDAYGAHNNLGLWFHRPCLQFFNSTVSPSIMEFYPSVGVKRDVNSKPEVKNYALRGLLSVRYTLVAKDEDEGWQKEAPEGWTLWGETAQYNIYENENYVPMGFTYDYYVTAEQLETVAESERAQILMRAVLLDDAQIAAYGSTLQPLPDNELTHRTTAAYAQDCADRRAAAVAEFTADNYGFTARTDYDTNRLVFFSVPYDEGFTATINGSPAQLEKVDNGLTALYVPAGACDIRVTYRTPGLDVSSKITAAAWILYLVYLCAAAVRRKKSQQARQ